MQVESLQPRLPGFDDDTPPEPPVDIFRRVFRAVRPRTPFPDFHINFCRFANANSFVSEVAGRLAFRITDALETAPAAVLEALAYILICKST